MADGTKATRLGKAAREFNVGIHTIVDFLTKKGVEVETSPNTRITPEAYALLVKEFQSEKAVKEESQKIGLAAGKEKGTVSLDDKKTKEPEQAEEEDSEELIIKGTDVCLYIKESMKKP